MDVWNVWVQIDGQWSLHASAVTQMVGMLLGLNTGCLFELVRADLSN